MTVICLPYIPFKPEASGVSSCQRIEHVHSESCLPSIEATSPAYSWVPAGGHRGSERREPSIRLAHHRAESHLIDVKAIPRSRRKNYSRGRKGHRGVVLSEACK
jgi:hypothetical protein